MRIMIIIAIKTFQDGWNLLVPGSYTSSTTIIQFSTSSPLKVSLENCRWFLSGTLDSDWNHSAPPAQLLSGSARRPPGGFRGRMQDVVCQLVGIGMVPQYVRKANGFQGTVRHGVRHGSDIISIMAIISIISIGMK